MRTFFALHKPPLQTNADMATKLKIAKEELAALYAHSGRQRAALKAAREALAAAGMAGAGGGAGGL